MGTDNVEM